jgi:hypothetical protein
MPTQKFDSLEAVYKSLTDFEIEDDTSSGGIPVAEINVKGIHRIKIGMVTEWEFYKYLDPMKNRMLAYFAQGIIAATTKEELERASVKIKNLLQEFIGLSIEETKKRVDKLNYFFEDKSVRHEFFKGLKKLGLIHWWVSWRRWQKKVRRHDTLAIFVLLWAFNYDGFKKKTTALLQTVSTIYASINSQSRTESSSCTDFGTFQKMYLKAHERFISAASSRN